MTGIQSIHQTLNFLPWGLPEKCPLPDLEPYREYLSSNSLVQRVTANWKIILMDCSTIICVAAVAITFLTGSTIICSAFAVAAIASGVAAFYMRQFSTLSDLEDTAQGLKVAKERFEGIANDFQRENTRLTEANRELQRNNDVFRESNQNLIQTNARLTQQVTQLALQVTQLRESAERIRTEVQHFQQANTHLNINVRAIDQQILSSRALCDQITAHLSAQQTGLGQISGQLSAHQQGLGEQLSQLRQYLADLSADNRVSERIQQLAALQTQTQQATTQLHQIQLQYAAELGSFRTIRDALIQIRTQFDAAIRDAQTNNQQFRTNVDALSRERQRIHDLLTRHFPTAVPI